MLSVGNGPRAQEQALTAERPSALPACSGSGGLQESMPLGHPMVTETFLLLSLSREQKDTPHPVFTDAHLNTHPGPLPGSHGQRPTSSGDQELRPGSMQHPGEWPACYWEPVHRLVGVTADSGRHPGAACTLVRTAYPETSQRPSHSDKGC